MGFTPLSGGVYPTLEQPGSLRRVHEGAVPWPPPARRRRHLRTERLEDAGGERRQAAGSPAWDAQALVGPAEAMTGRLAPRFASRFAGPS